MSYKAFLHLFIAHSNLKRFFWILVDLFFAYMQKALRGCDHTNCRSNHTNQCLQTTIRDQLMRQDNNIYILPNTPWFGISFWSTLVFPFSLFDLLSDHTAQCLGAATIRHQLMRLHIIIHILPINPDLELILGIYSCTFWFYLLAISD